MPGYVTLTTTRQTLPDPVALLAAVKTATGDPTAVLVRLPDGTYHGKKATAWSAPHIAAAQAQLDTVAALTPQLEAQRFVDAMSIYDKARDLVTIDQLNVLRAKLRALGATGIPDITPAQAIQAIRDKAGTL